MIIPLNLSWAFGGLSYFPSGQPSLILGEEAGSVGQGGSKRSSFRQDIGGLRLLHHRQRRVATGSTQADAVPEGRGRVQEG